MLGIVQVTIVGGLWGLPRKWGTLVDTGMGQAAVPCPREVKRAAAAAAAVHQVSRGATAVMNHLLLRPLLPPLPLRPLLFRLQITIVIIGARRRTSRA